MSLTRQDWLNAARQVLTEKGVEAVKVEALARALKVSKGSFYWHFKNRNDLLQELLKFWAQITDELIKEGESVSDPKERMTQLFSSIAESGVSGEEVIQVWAKHDETVAETLKLVEAKRLAYLQSIFKAAGFKQKDARERAEISYMAFLGYAFKASQDASFSRDFKDLGQEIISIMFQERTSK